MNQNPLLDIIHQKGWIPLDEALGIALYDPEHGYYTQREPLGKGGDFITAPEICSLFGEMMALWCLDTWQKMGSPTPIRLVEYGPGRGVMMSDMLRTFKTISPRLEKPFYDHLTCHLLEISPRLKEQQQARLDSHRNVFWHDHLDDVFSGFTLIVANEFFDALPIKQYMLKAEGWHERGLNGTPPQYADQPCDDPHLPFNPKMNSPCEVCPLDRVFAQQMGERLTQHQGAVLIIDYGDEASHWQGDTLQAIKSHEKYHPLKDLGKADITHHVDFHGLKRIFQNSGLTCHGVVPQGPFLSALGLSLRAEHLGTKRSDKERGALLTAVYRLMSAQEMGQLFKVLAISSTPFPMIGFSDD